MSQEQARDKMLREMTATRGKYIRFRGATQDGELVEWYVSYHGKFGWTAYRPAGDVEDPSIEEETVTEAFDVYDTAEIVTELPDGKEASA